MGKPAQVRPLTDEEKAQVLRLQASGLRQVQVAARLGLSTSTVSRLVGRRFGPSRRREWPPSVSRLSIEDRVEIKLGLRQRESIRTIAARIGRAPSTVMREIRANGGPRRYEPVPAHRRAYRQARRPKATKLSRYPVLRHRVEHDLCRRWSPEQIARRLRCDFGDDTTMTVSHETIYKSLFVQGRGELRRELARCLRSGRATRRHHGQPRPGAGSRIPDMVMISERPAEAQDRAVPGHWEGDLIVGKGNASVIGTLVERSTRYLMLLHLPQGRSAAGVRDAMTTTIQTLPASLRRSITWDQGKEMSEHAKFSIDTGVAVYFCDPRSPWQRGTNENTNGLLRQYFPKSTDLSKHSPQQLRDVADELNGRPRKTLGWKTPAEKLAELVAPIP